MYIVCTWRANEKQTGQKGRQNELMFVQIFAVMHRNRRVPDMQAAPS